MKNVYHFNEFERLLSERPGLNAGIIADSNIIFSISYELDLFYEDVYGLFQNLSKNNVPLYANVNIRTEFLELHRRVLIAESLIDFYEDASSEMSLELQHLLKSHRTNYRKSLEENRLFKIPDQKIKLFRRLLSTHITNGKNLWDLFCEGYFSERMAGIWTKAVDELNLNALSTRHDDDNKHITGDVSWENMEEIVRQFGIGVSDAMILNIFLNSNFTALATTDSDIAYAMERLKPKDKIVLMPDSANQ